MSTLRESAQWVDELRQHYRRLDAFLVRNQHKYSLAEQAEGTLYLFEMRKQLFGWIRDPNLPQPNEAELERAARALLSWPLPPEGRKLRLVEDAPTAPMSVHDPAEDLEVIP